MIRQLSPALRHALLLPAVALLAACADRAPMSPDARMSMEAIDASEGRMPDLGSCQHLAVPEGSKMTLKVFATGVQIYKWNGASWVFDAPEANLYADASGQGLVGTHFRGPKWLTNSGSLVEGEVAVDGRCAVAGTIAWLKLNAKPSGTGVFENTTHIHRLNTTGGVAPSAPGSFVGEEARVAYTADYYFYRAP